MGEGEGDDRDETGMRKRERQGWERKIERQARVGERERER